MPLIVGVDEAGRGPLIGDLVVGCVVMEEEDARNLNIPDSKKVKTKEKREALYDKVMNKAKQVIVVRYSAKEITDAQRQGFTMNEIETMMFAVALEGLENIDRVYLDAADINNKRFGNVIKKKSKLHSPQFISEHKADDKFPVVGAASIIAKVTRDRIVDEIAARHKINIGSGYPSDPHLKKWLLEQNGMFSPEMEHFVRMEWSTVKRLLK